MSKDRLAHIRAAAFRHKAKQQGRTFCKHCGGVTPAPEHDFCLRHYRMLPTWFRMRNSVEEQIEYLKLREAMKITWRSDGVAFIVQNYIIYQSAREGVPGMIIKDRETNEDVHLAPSIRQLREWLLERVGECSNRYAAKTKIR